MRLTSLRRLLPIALAIVAACGGSSEPDVRWEPGNTPIVVRTSTLEAGARTIDPSAANPFEGDARALAEGRHLYETFNCAGCHGPKGGGGIGPPFADADWIYGDAPENIYQSIVQGRPNGMPAFGGKMTDDSLWKVVAWVRSLRPANPEQATGSVGTDKRGGATSR